MTDRVAFGQTVVSTRDVGRAEEVLSASYLPLRIQPKCARTGLRTRLDAVALPHATIGVLHFGAHVRVVTEDASNYHVNAPVAGRISSGSGAGAAVIAPGQAEVFMPGTAADLRWEGDSTQICLMLDRVAVEQTLAAMLGADVSRPLRFARTIDLRVGGGRTWANIVRLASQEMQRGGGLLSSSLSRRTLDQLLLEGLLTCHRHNYSDRLQAPSTETSTRSIRTAVALLEAAPERPWTVSILAAELGISSRALHSGMRALVGMGPMTYLREVRLRRVHDELLTASLGTTTVGQVARRWGFNHGGRFSASYQRRYGRAPSLTLRNEP
jgi:AraC-like DNA-binding protein